MREGHTSRPHPLTSATRHSGSIARTASAAPHRRLAPAAVWCLSALLVLTGGVAFAKQKKRDIAGGEYRVLNEHQFATPQYVVSPFMNASLAIGLGFGSLETEATDGGQSTKLLLFQQQLQAQFGIYNWASVELIATGSAAIGGDLEDVVNLGALAQASAGGRIKARIFTLKNVGLQLAAAAAATYEHALTLRPVALLGPSIDLLPVNVPPLPQATLDALGVPPDAELLTTEGFTQVVPSLMLAYGTGPFGMQLSVSSPVRLPNEGDTVAFIEPGVHAAFDVGHYTLMFPIAITAEYALVQNLTDDATSHKVVGGLSYTGRRDLEFVLACGTELESATTLLYGLVGLHYFF